MFAFACISAFRWKESGLIFFGLLMFRELLSVFYLLIRNPDQSGQSILKAQLLAYASAAMPLMYFRSTTNSLTLVLSMQLLSIVGFCISTLALIELGRSFGVAPAKRSQKISTGIYGLFKHPMYAGYVISELGMCLVNPINFIILAVSFFLYFVRSKLETMRLNSWSSSTTIQ